MAHKKTKEALETIAKQLVNTWSQPDMPPWTWDMVRQEVTKVVYARCEAEIFNRVEALSLPELGRFIQVCHEMEKAGIMPKTPEAPPPAQEAAKQELAKIEAIPYTEPPKKAKGKK